MQMGLVYHFLLNLNNIKYLNEQTIYAELVSVKTS
jgi:hypothetical protein